MMRLCRLERFLVPAALLALVVSPLSIAEANSSDGRSAVLEEVVVVARKREENLQETPIAITAFSSENLERIGATDFMVTSEYTPNFMVVNTTSSNHNIAAAIRGISSAEPAFAQDPKIGFYLDGVYLAKNSGALFDIVDIERIEVLRGPQGTLYGRNTTGGAINIISEKPAGEFGFKQRLTGGNRGRFISTSTLDVPEFSNVSLRLSYMHRELDGLTKNSSKYTSVDDLGSEDTDAYRAALRWEPVEDITVDYSYDYSTSKSVAKAQQISYANPAYATVPVVTSFTPFTLAPDNPFAQLIGAGGVAPDGPLSRFNLDAVQPEQVDVEGHNLSVAWDWGNATLKSITSYRKYDSSTDSGLRGGSDFDGGAWDVPIFHIGTPASGGIQKEHEQFSQEFQLTGDGLSSRLQYTLGAFYFDEEAEEKSNQWDALIYLPAGTVPDINFDALYRQELILGPPPGGLGEHYSIDNSSWAVYGQATYSPDVLDSRLSVTLGLRYTEDKREATILDASPNWNEDADFSNTSPAVTVSYQISDDINVYGKVVTGYNAGSFPVRAGNPEAFAIFVDEETIIDYEIGFKSRWSDDRIQFNAAAFRYDFDDLQVSDFQAGSTVLVNAGEAEVQGLELEVIAIPLAGLSLSANYGYTDFEYKEFLVGGVDQADMAQAPFAPEHDASVVAEYEFQPSGIGTFLTRVDATYRDEYHFNPFNFEHDATDSVTLVNARLELNDIPIQTGDLRLALWCRNVTDEEYRDFGVDFGSLGFAVNTWAEQRSYGLDLVYEY